MPYERDPLSQLLDGGARRLLERAYAQPGTWVGTRLADPGLRARTFAAARGINPDGPDQPSARGGRTARTDARTRWARAFVRAVYYQHRWYSGGGQRPWRGERRTTPRDTGGLRFEVGRRVPASPQYDPANPAAGGFPAWRAVRIRLEAGARAKERAVARLPDSQRIYTDDGAEGARWSDPDLRDWA